MGFLKTIDYLGSRPVLNIKGSPSSKTVFGGFLSFWVTLLLLAGSSYFLNLLFSRVNYAVIQTDEYNNEQFMNWTNYEFSVYVVNRVGAKIPNDYKIFNMTGGFYNYQKIKNPDGTAGTRMSLEYFQMERCGLERNYPNSKDLWRDQKFINDSTCFPVGKVLNASLPYGDDGFTQVGIWINKCQNSSLNNNSCLPMEDIDKTLNNVNVLVRYRNYYFNHVLQDDPGVPYVHTDAPAVSATVYKKIIYTFQNVDYDTDDGFFLPEYRKLKYSIYLTVRESMDLRSDTNIANSFVLLNFNLGTMKKVIQKKYYKFQNMLADLGGLLKGVITIASLINTYLCDRVYFLQLINPVINNLVENNDEKKKTNPTKVPRGDNKSISSISSLAKLSSKRLKNSPTFSPQKGKSSSTFSEIEFDLKGSPPTKNKNYKNSFPSPLIGIKTPLDKEYRKTKLVLNWAALFFPLTCFNKFSANRKQLTLYFKFQSIINDQLDVITYLNKFHLVDKLNYIIGGSKLRFKVQNCFNPYYEKNGKVPEKSEFFEVEKAVLERLRDLHSEKFD
jgi:hypothetical protein